MSSGTGVAAPIARGRAAKGLGPGVRVKRKARHFGEEWAKQTFRKSWTMSPYMYVWHILKTAVS